MAWLMVMAGGAVGSAARYALSLAMNPSTGTGMPWGTLVANVLGCLLIGWLSATLATAGGVSEAVRLGILVGLLGGFTTFSSFGLETVSLLQSGQGMSALLYVLLSNLGGLAGAWLGLRLA